METDYLLATAAYLRYRINSLIHHVLFDYKGIPCGVDPFSHKEFDVWYGDKAETMTSIDEVMYYETERRFVFSGRWYGGGLPKVEKKTGRVGWYLEEWGNRDKAKWKATEDIFTGSFEDSLGPIYDSIKEKQEIVRKNQLPDVHNPYPESKEHKTIFQKFLDKIGW